MKEKRNWKREIKDWWNENKGKIKVGLFCGAIGIGYGFIKGMSASDKLWIDGLKNAVTGTESKEPCDEFGLTESNCDDPEFAELVKFENENA